MKEGKETEKLGLGVELEAEEGGPGETQDEGRRQRKPGGPTAGKE